MRILTKQEAFDIIYGCAIVGTGGGGNLSTGLEMVDQCFKAGKEIRLAELSELKDDDYVATPYGCGAPKLLNDEVDEKFKDLPRLDYPEALLAFRTLEEHMGVDFFAVASSELGAESTAEAMYTAAHLGLPVMNADAAGRSVPDLQYSTYFVKKKPIYPMGIATEFGESVIIKDVVNDFRAEAIARAIAVVSNDMVGVADHPMTGKDYKESVIPEAMTFAMNMGRTLREVRENGGKGPQAAELLAERFGGEVRFQGTISDAPWEVRDGYNYGRIHIDGTDRYRGDTYLIHFKNENILSYWNDEIDVTSPDLICMIGEDGIPVNTPNFEKGQKLSILALPAPEIWTTEEGLKCFDLNYFGFDVPYTPFK